MARLFFLLSGEHPTLPTSELKAILEAERHAFRTVEKLDQVLRLEADPNCVSAIRRRSAFTRLCGLEVLSCDADMRAIVNAVNSTSLEDVLSAGESFVVRVRRVRDSVPHLRGVSLESKIGELILETLKGSKVNLRHPDKTFVGILSGSKFIFGLQLAEIPAKPFMERRPRKKPFFHPSAMTAKFSRGMVNLAEPKEHWLVFDPFCGTGGMLIEAGLIGCRVFGLDVQRRMVRGSLKNLAFFGVKPEGVVLADARVPPLCIVDCVVTDPPYGTSATTLKRATRQIFEEAFVTVQDMVPPGRRVCMAAPKKLDISAMGAGLGYKHLESHFVYVHRSLTREIAVFEKV